MYFKPLSYGFKAVVKKKTKKPLHRRPGDGSQGQERFWGPHPPGPQVVQQVIANLGLLLVELREKIQEQREAAVVFLHLTQVPGGGVGEGEREQSCTQGRPSSGGRRCLCPRHVPPFWKKGPIPPGQKHRTAKMRMDGPAVSLTAGPLPKYQIERLPHRLLQGPARGGGHLRVHMSGENALQADNTEARRQPAPFQTRGHLLAAPEAE